jgi:CBS domain-containing protein
MNVADLMTRDVISVDPEATLREVASVLVTEHIGGVPVVAGASVLGVVSATDLLEFDADAPGSPVERPEAVEGPGESPDALAEGVEGGDEAAAAYFTDFWEDAGADVVERFGRTEGPEWNVLDEHVASEVMSEVVFSLPPDTGVAEAARRMLEADVHRALVVEDGRLVGVLTSLDILGAVAEHGLATGAPRPAGA